MNDKKYKRLLSKVQVLEDIIENKTRELYQEQEFSSRIIDLSESVIIALDKHENIKKINNYGLSIFNKSINDVLGKALDVLLNKEQQRELYLTGELSIIVDEFKSLSFLFKASEPDEYNETIITGLDITEIKKAHEKIQQQDLSMINQGRLKSLGEMSSMMAHEVKNPLGIMDGQLRRLRKAFLKKDQDKEKISKLLLQIENNIQRINKIINSLKMASRDSSHDDLEEICIDKVLVILDDLISEKMKIHNILFAIENNSRKIKIKGKVSELEQVCLNLLSNSIDAVKDKKDPWIKLIVDHDKEYLKLTFIDSGDKISKEVQDKIFEPFFTTKNIGEGTGIGMTIVQKILESHNATIEIDCNSPYTCFIVKIPMDESINNLESA